MLGAGCTIRFHTIVYKTASKLLQLLPKDGRELLYAIHSKKNITATQDKWQKRLQTLD